MKYGAPFNPYRGNDPYLFVSYAHKDRELVYRVIRSLHDLHYRIWYDEGIEAGQDWPQIVAQHLLDADTVVIFVSQNAMNSQNCLREIHYAVAQKKKMIAVYTDSCTIPDDIGMQLGIVPSIHSSESETITEELIQLLQEDLIGDGVSGYEPEEPSSRHAVNHWFVISVVMAVLLVLLSGYLILSMNGCIRGTGISQTTADSETGEVSITHFNDASSMEVLLNSIHSEYIHICGNNIVSDASIMERKDGRWYISDQPVEQGPVNRLSAFTGKTIRQLSLVNESLQGLSGAEKITGLTYLDVSDNPIRDLSALASAEDLEVLKLYGIPQETDLSVLAQLPNLKQVCISYDHIEGIKPLIDAGIEIIVGK